MDDYVFDIAVLLADESVIVPDPGVPASIDGFVQLSSSGVLVFKKGYAWNGANVVMDTKTIMRASLVHDGLYQLIKEKKLPKDPYRKIADNALYRVSRIDEMGWFRANYIYLGVRIGGRFFV